jgi:hypothetical protein
LRGHCKVGSGRRRQPGKGKSKERKRKREAKRLEIEKRKEKKGREEVKKQQGKATNRYIRRTTKSTKNILAARSEIDAGAAARDLAADDRTQTVVLAGIRRASHNARIRVDAIVAQSVGWTRVRAALVDVGLTERTGETRNTAASKRADAVNTGPGVAARVRAAFVDIGLTERAREADRTGTRKAVDSI